MVDNSQETPATSSQENYSLPLSQEAFQYLWEELTLIPPIIDIPLDNSHFNNSVDISNGLSSDAIPLEPLPTAPVLISKIEVSSSSTTYAPSSLPASKNWAGPYNFNVTFGPQKKETKGVAWTYSKLKDKLYVGKDVPCPVDFRASTDTSDNVCIRAMALYGSPEHASEIVHRCVNHSMEETNKNIFEAEHLVRCESTMATYNVDPTTKRHSVVVPFEIPPAGQPYSTYIYKFACFGSCAGGPNRRPIMLVFSLEKDGQVVGRRKLDVKICACPGRDRKAEELQLMPEEKIPLPKKRKDSEEPVSLADSLNFTKTIKLPPVKKLKHPHKSYTLTVDNKEQYEYLVQMNKLYEMCETMNNLPPQVKRALAYRRHKHHQEGDSN